MRRPGRHGLSLAEQAVREDELGLVHHPMDVQRDGAAGREAAEVERHVRASAVVGPPHRTAAGQVQCMPARAAALGEEHTVGVGAVDRDRRTQHEYKVEWT